MERLVPEAAARDFEGRTISISHEDQMSGLNVWGCTGNLEHTQHLIEKGGVLEVFCRINLDYLKGYTVRAGALRVRGGLVACWSTGVKLFDYGQDAWF